LPELTIRCEEHARRSLVDCLLLASRPTAHPIERVPVGLLRADDAGPILEWADAPPVERRRNGDSPLALWAENLGEIANRWISR
jgi:hypothetical protein